MGKNRIIFCGTGMIGAGLAVNALLNDNEVALYDVISKDKMQENIQKVIDIMVEAGAVEETVAAEKMKTVTYFNDLKEALRDGADMVQECVPEKIDLKKSTYRTVQEVLGKNTIICSSTSAMFPSALQEGALYPENIVVGHPYNPSYLLPLVEICGPAAAQETLDKAVAIYKAMGKVPVICKKEVKGYLVNNISWQVFYAAANSVKDGLCSAEDADKALMYGPGMRMAVLGQLLTISLGIQGGIAKAPEKYGLEPDELYDIVGASIDEEMAARDPKQGNTVEDIEKFRDKAFAQILKIHGLL